jgi:SAM-dependent methyltransferase
MAKITNTIRDYGLVWLMMYTIEQKLKIRLPLSAKLRWDLSVKTEVRFWDKYFATKGLSYPEDYLNRLKPDTALDKEITDLLPQQPSIEILDVGAGPMTYLGKKWNNVKINITAVDPLANEYDKLMTKYGVNPVVRTQKLDAEALTSKLAENSFDLAYARNCIDHSYSPETSVLQMLKVTKSGCYVLLIHSQNEAIKEKWEGLHQWNFSMEGSDFIISSKNDKLNFSKKYAHLCETTFTYEAEKDWIHVKLLKK